MLSARYSRLFASALLALATATSLAACSATPANFKSSDASSTGCLALSQSDACLGQEGLLRNGLVPSTASNG